MTISLTELRRLHFADAMYGALFPDATEARDQPSRLYEFLWKKIVDQELRPGDRVLDTAIAAEAGVSRTPVREAIQRLVQDGLLEPLARGVRVVMVTQEDMVALYDYRAALETFAARRAAQRLPRREVERLLAEDLALAARLCAPGGHYDPRVAVDTMRWDVGLHHLLLRHGANPYVTRAMASIQARLSLFQVAGTRVPGGMEEMQRQHRAILEALLARDGEGAARAMLEHIERSKAHSAASYFGRAEVRAGLEQPA